MTRKHIGAALLALSIVGSAEARRTATAVDDATHLLPISAAVGMKNAKTILGKDVKLYFGERVPMSAVEASFGVVYAKGEAKGEARPTAKSRSRKDGAGCKEAMRSALARLIEQARERKANAVVRIVSYYHSLERAGATEYECHTDSSGAVVELKGEVVKLRSTARR